MRGQITVRTHKAGTHKLLSPFVATLNGMKLMVQQSREHTSDYLIPKIENLQNYINTVLDQSEICEPNVTKNLIMQAPNVGKDMVVQRLLGVNTYSLNLTYGEIGTGTATPAITDTALQTPVARASLTLGVTQNIGNNQAQIQYFYPDNVLTNSTYTEFGCFVDGSATLGTGQLFNHSLFTTAYAKAGGTDITVQVLITLT